jgi:MFS family permease
MMNSQTSTPPPGDFKNRKTGLVVFGILTMAMGGLCALIVPLMIFGLARAATTTGVHQSLQGIFLMAALYGLVAVALIWLGIGSIMARRWARALLLIFSWCWLIMGVIVVAITAVMVPRIVDLVRSVRPAGQPELPPSASLIFVLIPAVIFGVIFVVLPGVWVLFYGSKHVKATCETCDPVPRWTDRCPLPVLALSLGLALGAPMMLVMPLTNSGVFPFFGMFLTGLPGTLAYVVLAAVWAYSAWACYRLDRRGWWVIFASMIVFAISGAITYSLHDVAELYRLMNYPEEQIAQFQKFNVLNGSGMAWLTLLCMAPWIGYLLYVRTFFRRDV